jgi:hypothetical protein
LTFSFLFCPCWSCIFMYRNLILPLV